MMSLPTGGALGVARQLASEEIGASGRDVVAVSLQGHGDFKPCNLQVFPRASVDHAQGFVGFDQPLNMTRQSRGAHDDGEQEPKRDVEPKRPTPRPATPLPWWCIGVFQRA